ncbi:unnamed protein product [Pleuronectes platessa]|uniref:Uncharacterized protein n=1 Tax=Pleuronectes platessa TaxID=8262 RepID=A0A9N7V9M4_PLEPL|nr:unnamed protein product [Pleuronectes platessa]
MLLPRQPPDCPLQITDGAPAAYVLSFWDAGRWSQSQMTLGERRIHSGQVASQSKDRQTKKSNIQTHIHT